jgi:hypothetical protein
MDTAGTDMMSLTAVDLLTVDRRGPDGVLWSLARGGDLDANLVHLAPGRAVCAHGLHDPEARTCGSRPSRTRRRTVPSQGRPVESAR